MSATIGVREGRPAVNVKDDALYAHDTKFAAAMEPLGEDRVEAIYEGVARDFWDHYAPEIARDHGYEGTIWSAGRSGGWLYLDDLAGFGEYGPDADDVPYGGNVTEAEAQLDYRRERGTCGECLARCYRSEDCVCDEDTMGEYDPKAMFDEAQGELEACREFERFVKFANAIEAELTYCRAQFLERLIEAAEAIEHEASERSYWAARDVQTV